MLRYTYNDQQTIIRREDERIVDGYARNELARVFELLDQINGHISFQNGFFEHYTLILVFQIFSLNNRYRN